MTVRRNRAGRLALAIACIAGVGIACPDAFAEDTGIHITTDNTEYAANSGELKYTIHNGGGEAAYILFCPAAFLEFKQDDAWKGILESRDCETSMLAHTIEPGASLEASCLLPSLDEGAEPVSCRVAQRFYFGCTGNAAGGAFVTCSRRTEVVRSNEFVVK